MFVVIEFDHSHGGGLALIHEKWLTPPKQETFSPPAKSVTPEDDWKIFKTSRVFF